MQTALRRFESASRAAGLARTREGFSLVGRGHVAGRGLFSRARGEMLRSIYEATSPNLEGTETIKFDQFKGKVLLVVNVASK